MKDYTSLLAKINALKAMVEQSSITPAYLGAILDDIAAAIQGVDLTSEMPAASRNAADALAAANIAVTKAGNAESTASSAAALVAQLRADLDAIDHDNATEAIESFREILAFLDGCKDDETLLAKLTEIKALISAEATDRQSAIAAALNTAQVADFELQEQIAEHRRELHYLPDNFATEKALFTAAGTYTIGTQPIKPGALLLGCVDECWGVYQYVYFNETEISAQSAEAVQAASAAAPTVAPPAVKHDANVANPEHWVRLATIEDVAALKKLVPVVEITAEEIAALLPADESQIATLELDAEDDVAGADQPATCDALERFRTRLREMRGRSVFKPKEVYNPNDYINYEHE